MPQVTILEGGKPKSFAGVDKLQIALSGGGTSLWVPKDTRLLTSLTANENGTYPPPEGYFGFDTAIVNVMPSQVAGIDPETGQYIVVGYKKVETDDPGWGTGSEGDGSEDDPWSLDPTDPWDPDTDGGYGWGPWEVPDGGDWEPPSDWPTTENELTQEPIPSGIKIVQPPNKTQYTVGETIDYSGIQVQLVDVDGNLFTNSRYPDGLVPFSELSFDPTKAPMGGTFDYYTNGHGVIIRRVTSFTTGHEYMNNRNVYVTPFPVLDGYGVGFRMSYSGTITYLDLCAYRKDAFGEKAYTIYYKSDVTGNRDGLGLYMQRPDGQWSLVKGAPTSYPTNNRPTNIPVLDVNPYEQDMSDLKPLGFKASAIWNSPYDGKSYRDSTSLQLVYGGDSGNTSDPEGGGGGFSGGGGEGTGGGGGGGGF